MLFSTCLFVYNARNSLSTCSNSTKIGFKGPTPKGRGREGRGGPRKIVHPEKFLRIGPEVKYTDIAVCGPTCLTATGTHMPAEVTFPALPPAEAGTRLSDPGGMQG